MWIASLCTFIPVFTEAAGFVVGTMKNSLKPLV